MSALKLMLLDGFADDEVVVRIDGRETAHREGVTTKLLLGKAESVRAEVPSGGVTVEVEVRSRDARAETIVDARTDATLLVSLEGGELRLRQGTGREGAM